MCKNKKRGGGIILFTYCCGVCPQQYGKTFVFIYYNWLELMPRFLFFKLKYLNLFKCIKYNILLLKILREKTF
jgi:hypothetical protein